MVWNRSIYVGQLHTSNTSENKQSNYSVKGYGVPQKVSKLWKLEKRVVPDHIDKVATEKHKGIKETI